MQRVTNNADHVRTSPAQNPSRLTVRRAVVFGLQVLLFFALFLALYMKALPSYERLVVTAVNAGYGTMAVPLEIRTAPRGDDLSAYVLAPGLEPQWLVTHHTPEGVFLSLILLPSLLMATPVGIRERLKLLLLGSALLYVVHVVSVGVLFRELFLFSRHQLGPFSSWLYAASLTSGQVGAVVVWALVAGGTWFRWSGISATLRVPVQARLHRLWAENRTMFRCWLVFVAILAVFHLLLLVGWNYWDIAALWTARSLAWTLSLLGYAAHSEGTKVVSSLYSVNIIRDCTAIHPIGIFLAGVLAYPAGWRSKLLAVGGGVLALLAVNQVRLVSLCYVGRWYQRGFEVAHVIVWQGLIVLFSVGFFLAWTVLADRR